MKPAGADLTKLHLINTLFASLTGDDLYLAHQVKSAIDESIGHLPETEKESAFTNAAEKLLRNYCLTDSQHCFTHWNSPGIDNGFNPLWARLELISLFKKLAPCRRATVVITGLHHTIRPPGKRWTKNLRREYTEAIRLIQEIALNWSTRRAEITLLFL